MERLEITVDFHQFWFANNIDAFAWEEQEVEILFQSFDKIYTRHKMKIADRKNQTDEKYSQWRSGPGCSKLTMSLVNVSLKFRT